MEIIQDVFYHVTVKKILPNGIIVIHSDNDSDFIHVSNVSDKFVEHVEDFVKVGQEFEAQCIVGKFKPVELSLKHLKLRSNKPKSYTPATSRPSAFQESSNKSAEHRIKADTAVHAVRDACETANLDEMIADFNKAHEENMRKNKHARDRSYRHSKGKKEK